MFDDIFSPNDIHILAASLIVHIRCCEHDIYMMDKSNSDIASVEALLNECEKLFGKIKDYADSNKITLNLDRSEPVRPDGFPQ